MHFTKCKLEADRPQRSGVQVILISILTVEKRSELNWARGAYLQWHAACQEHEPIHVTFTCFSALRRGTEHSPLSPCSDPQSPPPSPIHCCNPAYPHPCTQMHIHRSVTSPSPWITHSLCLRKINDWPCLVRDYFLDFDTVTFCCYLVINI